MLTTILLLIVIAQLSAVLWKLYRKPAVAAKQQQPQAVEERTAYLTPIYLTPEQEDATVLEATI